MAYAVFTKKCAALTGFLCLGLSALSAQVFWSESFNDEAAAATHWVNGGTNPGPADWTWTGDPAAGYQDPDLPAFAAPTATGGYFYFNADNNGQVPFDVTLTGAGVPANCAGKTDVRLRFFTQYIYFNPAGTLAQLGVSTDGVNFIYQNLFDGLQANFPYHNWVEVDLDAADNQPQVWLRFRWVGNYEYHWKIDDLQLFVPCGQNPAAIICDDFNQYDLAQKLGPQSGHWTTWSGVEGADEDGAVTAEQANTPPYALKITGTDPAGGPQNAILDLGTRFAGRYELSWNMLVPAGKRAYFTLQNNVPVGSGEGTLFVFFDDNGAGSVRQKADGPLVGTFSYPEDHWFEIRQVFDLDNNLLLLLVNNQFVLKRGYLKNLGGIQFFGRDGQHQFYVDDIAFLGLPPLVYQPDSCDTAVDISQYFGQTPDIAQITGLFDNSGATVAPTDPEVSCWNEAGAGGLDILNTTMWFTFTGDGDTYDIQTVPCNAAHYIGAAQGSNGDTQLLVYAGENCSELTAVACNDDLFPTGIPDWRAGVQLETTPGQNYYMLIDGFEKQGVVATGEFCVQITRQPSVPCAQGQAGTYQLAGNGFLCFSENLVDILDLDAGSFVLPTVGPQYGLAWCFSQDPIPAGVWPGAIPGIASTPFAPEVKPPFLLNNGSSLNYGVYYLTPVVLGGGSLINPGTLPYVFNINPAGACFFVGTSSKIVLLPALSGLAANAQATNETLPPGANGAISLLVNGGAGGYLNDASLYQYLWSNGKTTRDINGLTAGAYTVTISDRSSCTSPLVLVGNVGQTVGSAAPETVRRFDVWPNPARDAVRVELELHTAAELRLTLFNLVGQPLAVIDGGRSDRFGRTLDLSLLPDGVYFLQLAAGAETLQRRIALRR